MPHEVDISSMDPGRFRSVLPPERVEEFEDAGVDLLLLQCSPQLDEMERFANQVMAKDAICETV